MDHVRLVSIVIPTRNRPDYAVPAISRLLAIESPDLEVVVSDNSDSGDTQAGLAPMRSDPRLRYARVEGTLTLSENFEQACRLATGHFIGCIGDDDNIHPILVDVAAWAAAHDFDAVASPVIADYGWPDFVRRYYGADSAAVLRVRPFSGEVSYPSVDEELEKLLRAGGQDFARMPRVYYGLIARRCFDRVRARYGACFPGVSPDMAGAVALSSEVSRMCWMDFPLFLPGSSRKSGSGQSARKQHVGRMEDQKHMGGDRLLVWPTRVPRFYSVQTVWAASVFTALDATGRSHLARSFDDARLHAMCAVFNPSYARTTVEHLRALRGAGVANASMARFAVHYASTWGMRVRSLTSRAWGAMTVSRDRFHENLPDIGAAVDRLVVETREQARDLLVRLQADADAAPR